jgi:hypothetical protein
MFAIAVRSESAGGGVKARFTAGDNVQNSGGDNTADNLGDNITNTSPPGNDRRPINLKYRRVKCPPEI